MNNLLLINKDQFGYHTDTYAYCHYLPSQFDTVYLCLDQGKPQISLEGVRVIYVKPKFKRLKISRAIAFWYQTWKLSKEFDLVFVKYFQLCSVFTRNKKNTLCDVRTRSVKTGMFRRKIENLILKVEVSLFPNLSVVSSRVGEILDRSDAFVIPLGTFLRSSLSVDASQRDQTRVASKTLIYIGTLVNRDMDLVVEGLSLYNKENINDKIRLQIFGEYMNEAGLALQSTVTQLSMDPFVEFFGWMSQPEISKFTEGALAGLVQVPENSTYEGQPSTKLFEYWSFGLPVLASENRENQRFLTNALGVSYLQTAEGFAVGLDTLVKTQATFHSEEILESAKKFSWEQIYQNDLLQALNIVSLKSNQLE